MKSKKKNEHKIMQNIEKRSKRLVTTTKYSIAEMFELLGAKSGLGNSWLQNQQKPSLLKLLNIGLVEA